ncbi:DNA-primase RepB domain-containing protein [Variovorax ureilyticus]|uniref:DNA-primase RepB domain-containing protein n=1 Tax=Variovorax ureilyticus TaxID=1836198 RepID=UPI003D670BB3
MQALISLLVGKHIYTRPGGGKLKGCVSRVLRAVAVNMHWTDEVRQDEGCWPGQKKIGANGDVSERTVSRNLKAAVELNIVRYVEQGAGKPNRTLFHPAILEAARQFGKLSQKKQDAFVVYLSELPPWGAPEVSDVGNAIKVIADKNAIKVIEDKMSRKSLRGTQPPPPSCRVHRTHSKCASGRGCSSPRPQGQGAVPTPCESDPARESMLVANEVPLDPSHLKDLGLGEFGNFLDSSGIEKLMIVCQRRKIDGTRGGIFRRGMAQAFSDIEDAILWAASQYAYGSGATCRIEVLCSSPRLLLVDDVLLSSVEAYCKKMNLRAVVLETSPGNYQALFVAPIGFTDLQCANARRSLTAAFLAERDLAMNIKGADPNAVGRGQLHRLPGSFNCKNGPDGQPGLFITRLAAVFEGNELSEALFPEGSEKLAPREPRSSANSDEAVDDSRVDFRNACSMVRRGLPPSAIQAAIYQSATRPDRRRVRSPDIALAYAIRTTREAQRRVSVQHG